MFAFPSSPSIINTWHTKTKNNVKLGSQKTMIREQSRAYFSCGQWFFYE